jgi:UDP-N-acetylmuramate dehydrogenase
MTAPTVRTQRALAELTTLRVGGPAARLVEATTEAELVAAVQAADDAGEPLLVLGGGSNVLVADAGFPGTVVLVRTSGVTVESRDMCGGAFLRVAAGEPWDDVAALAVESGWVGVEALSGIPGLTGATPIQNVGAYGQETSDTLARLRVYDRERDRIQTLFHGDCDFGYRTSQFKASSRFVVLDVTFQLLLGGRSAPIRYPELAAALGIPLGTRAPLADVREAVLGLRRAKGMVLDPDDRDTWSAGSFFTNPVLDADAAAALPADAPRWPQPDGTVKASAAWLIEQSGLGRGFALPGGAGRAALSGKHTLALINRGGASAGDLVALARTIRAAVRDRFAITLVPEPVLVGLTL